MDMASSVVAPVLLCGNPLMQLCPQADIDPEKKLVDAAVCEMCKKTAQVPHALISGQVLKDLWKMTEGACAQKKDDDKGTIAAFCSFALSTIGTSMFTMASDLTKPTDICPSIHMCKRADDWDTKRSPVCSA